MAEFGFHRLIVEKPLALGLDELTRITELRARHRLDVVVVGHWLTATLTRRLDELVRTGRFGPLRSITVDQDKPRFGRSASGTGHPSAFDVEIPHALAVALMLAGPAELADAGWAGRPAAGRAAGPLGGAWLSLRHRGGVRTTIRSDLTSPVRRRRIVLRLTGTTVTGHFSVSADDHHAQLRIGAGDREVFADEALGGFLLACYRFFAGEAPAPPGDFDTHTAVVRLLHEAKRRTEVAERAG